MARVSCGETRACKRGGGVTRASVEASPARASAGRLGKRNGDPHSIARCARGVPEATWIPTVHAMRQPCGTWALGYARRALRPGLEHSMPRWRAQFANILSHRILSHRIFRCRLGCDERCLRSAGGIPWCERLCDASSSLLVDARVHGVAFRPLRSFAEWVGQRECERQARIR